MAKSGSDKEKRSSEAGAKAGAGELVIEAAPGLATAGLADSLRKALQEPPVACGEEFQLNVFNRELVRDCKDKTSQEVLAMARALSRKGRSAGRQICALNGDRCPEVQFVRVEIVRDECCARLWEVDVRYTYRCVRRGS